MKVYISEWKHCGHSMSVNRLMWHAPGCVCQKNGTRYRDGIKVLECHSYFVLLLFGDSIPKCTVLFPFGNFFALVLFQGDIEQVWMTV